MPEPLISTMLVEDHEITRLGIRKMLERMPEISIVAELSDGKAAVKKAAELRPTLVLMDIGLPGMDGIEATKAIKATVPAKVILITSHESDEDIFAGLSAGADAYCLKGVSATQLATAIRSVIDDAMWLDPGIAKQVVQAVARRSRADAEEHRSPENDISGLSEREVEILTFVVDGLSNQQIAERLFLSVETVKYHMRHVMEKLSVSDRTQAAVKAVRQGLIGSSGSGPST